LCDLLLGRAVSEAVEGAQHAMGTGTLLSGQTPIRRNRPAVNGGEKTVDGFEPIEAAGPEGHDCCQRLAFRNFVVDQDLGSLTRAEVMERRGDAFVRLRRIDYKTRRGFAPGSQDIRFGYEGDDACIVRWKPEYWCAGKILRRIDRKIATPNASGSTPALAQHPDWPVKTLRSHGCRLHCGEATPRRDRRRSIL
jgi:hypothetical protein